jgi:hypothetical protein
LRQVNLHPPVQLVPGLTGFSLTYDIANDSGGVVKLQEINITPETRSSANPGTSYGAEIDLVPDTEFFTNNPRQVMNIRRVNVNIWDESGSPVNLTSDKNVELAQTSRMAVRGYKGDWGCTDDGDCALCQICTSGACVPGCRNDSQAGPGQICEGGQCTDGCRDDFGCLTGEICKDEECKLGCRVDTDCGFCQVCGVDDVCVKKEPEACRGKETWNYPACRCDLPCSEGGECDGDLCDQPDGCGGSPCADGGYSCGAEAACQFTKSGNKYEIQCSTEDSTCSASGGGCVINYSAPGQTNYNTRQTLGPSNYNENRGGGNSIPATQDVHETYLHFGVSAPIPEYYLVQILNTATGAVSYIKIYTNTGGLQTNY